MSRVLPALVQIMGLKPDPGPCDRRGRSFCRGRLQIGTKATNSSQAASLLLLDHRLF